MGIDDAARQPLKLPSPWQIEETTVRRDQTTVEVRVSFTEATTTCPGCGRECKKHDTVERRWRHLDMWE